MSREEAHRLLNMVRRGLDLPESRITEALIATGDVKSFGLGYAPHLRAPVTWELPMRRAA
jgi:hypothetical protein